MISAASSMIAADGLRSKILAFVLGASALLAAPTLAHAEGPTPAETLFREGRMLLDAKRYDEACPKLAESQKLEPGAGTLLALAMCHEGQGKTASASAELKRASELGRRNGRNDLATAADKRAQALAASVPRLAIHLPEKEEKAEKEASSYRVRCDGEEIPSIELGAPIAMDPGEHRIEVAAEGKTSRSYVVRLSGPGTTEIVIDKLDDVAPRAPAAPKADRAVVGATDAAPVGAENRGGAQRTIGLVLVGAGVIGLGTGAYFGGRALSESGEAKRVCPTAGSCPDEGNSANERSKDSFRVSVISLAAGTGALAIGAIVYFAAPSGSDSRGDTKPPRRTARVIPAVGPDGASLGLVGTF